MSKTKQTANPFEAFNMFSGAPGEAMKRMMGMSQGMSGNATGGFSALGEAAKVTMKGTQEIAAKNAEFFKEAMTKGMEASKAVTSAESVQQAIELQAGYTKDAMTLYMGQMNKMAGLMAQTMREASRPFNEQAGKMAEAMNSAA